MMNKSDILELLKQNMETLDTKLIDKAIENRNKFYGNKVFIRGLVEFTSYCRNDCYYCGLRRSNKNAIRYRMSKDEIIKCITSGYKLGLNSFVLQGGEDMYYTDKILCDIIYSIKEKFPNCAVTLSVGERTKESYKAYFDAGVDRFLLRHESADDTHYNKLHPFEMSLKNRMKCLYNLKEIGFQVGAGFMVGSPYQTLDNLASDLLFLQEIKPHMVGIGPFLPHKDTPFKNEKSGNLQMCITLLVLTRMILSDVLLPATTALESLDKEGKKKALSVGANVVMPKLTPEEHVNSYKLYDREYNPSFDIIKNLENAKKQIESLGLIPDMSRGDHTSL